jgi:hypothetical protein
LISFCCIFAVLIGVIVLGVVTRGNRRKGEKNGQV